jgi:hypothetical protein
MISEPCVVDLLAGYGDWWRSAAPSRERNAEEGPVLLGVPVISFPCSPISLKERSLKVVSVFSVLLGLFGSLRAPVSGARDPLVGSYPCWLSPSPKPAEGRPPKAAPSCSIRWLRNSCRNAWQKVML